MTTRSVLYRRSPHIVGHWSSGHFVLRNYATGIESAANPLVTRVLDYFDDWRSPDDLQQELAPRNRKSFRRILSRLVRRTLLQRADRRPSPSEESMASWRDWNPEAGFLHTATRDLDYERGEARAERLLARRVRTAPRVAPRPDRPLGRRRQLR